MVRQATSITWKEMLSDTEALIREAEYIKAHKPRYNIVMRDDKQYFFVRFSDGAFPRITLTHQPNSSKDYFLGPFTDGSSLKQTLKMLRHAFPYCTCKGAHKRRCQHASIGNCLGICCTESAYMKALFPDYQKRSSQYKKNIRTIKQVLSGKGNALMHTMQKRMKKLSEHKHYEQAALIRDQLYALENIFSHRHTLRREEHIYAEKGVTYLKHVIGMKKTPKRIEAYDISNIQGKHAVGSMVVFTNGAPDKNEYRKFAIHLPPKPNDTAMMQEIITRRFYNAWTHPDLIIIDGGTPQLHAAQKALAHHTLRMPVAALAKREEELHLQNGTVIKLKERPQPLLHLLQYIRNEAHRFAISFHRKKRGDQIGS